MVMDKDNDMLVQLIREEMVNAEKNLLDWNAFWREVYVYADVPYSFFNEFCGSEQDVKKHLESYGIDWFKISSSKSGQTPIKTLTIDGKYDCPIMQIDWNSIITNNSVRSISFENNGDIYFSKESNGKGKYSYDSRYNVSSSDFAVEIRHGSSLFGTNNEKYNISVDGNIVTKKNGNVVITDNLLTGEKTFRLVSSKENNPRAVVFEAVYDSNGILNRSSLELNTFKSSGKINGTYRFNFSLDKGTRINFYSRKGKCFDLSNNLEICEKLKRVALSYLDDDEKQIVSEYFDVMQKHQEIGINNTGVVYNLGNFGFEHVSNRDKKVINILKMIKGEIPLDGLTKRINTLFEKMNVKDKEACVKTLKPQKNNNV